MIDPKNVRVGNLFYVGNIIWKLDSVITGEGQPEFFFEENTLYNHYINAEPIPLTPLLLEKAGFIMRETNEISRMGIDTFNNAMILFYGTYCRALCSTDGRYFGRDCKYLHEVQNLFYMLSGRELEFELPL